MRGQWAVGSGELRKGSGEKLKAEVHLAEMGVAGEHLRDAEILHDDHRREIDEGDVWLVAVFQPHLVSLVELFRGNEDEPMPAGLDRLEQIVREMASRPERQCAEQCRYELAQD